MALAHELFHAGTYQRTDFFKPYCNWLCNMAGGPWDKSNSFFERQAILYTNQIRLDQAQGYIRTYYSGYGGYKLDSYDKAKARNK